MDYKAFLVSKGLTEEQATAIVDGMKAEKIYISSEENIDVRYSKLKGQHEDLKTELSTANATITDLQKANKDNEALQATLSEYKTTIETIQKDSANKIRNMKLDDAIKAKLSGADEKYHGLLSKEIDRDKIVVNEDGTLTGLDEQANAIKETFADLFKVSVAGKGTTNVGTATPGGAKAELQQKLNDPKTSFIDRIAIKNQIQRLGDE